MHLKQFSFFRRWIIASILSLLTIAFVWQGMFVANETALANPIMLADTGIENKVDRDVERTKSFIEDTKQQVKETANQNASKVDRATDEDSAIDNKAERDTARIEQKANKDAARTKEAVDKTQNIIESTIDNVKDVFSN